jgi:hypothetical protein
MTKTLGARLLHFGVACFALAVIPLYSVSHLPLSGSARVLALPSMLLFCFGGAAVFAWGLIQKAAQWVSGPRRWSPAILLVILIQCALVITLGGLFHASRMGSWGLIAVAAVAGLGGGAWALGGVLQWLWVMSDPNRSASRRSSLPRVRHGYPLARKAVTRG